MSMKFKVSLIFFVSIIFIGTTLYVSSIDKNPIIHTSRAFCSYVQYSNVDELDKKSDIIVIAQPEKDITECTPVIKYIQGTMKIEDAYTVSPFKVIKLIKGDLNKTIDVLQPVVLITQGDEKFLRILGDFYTVANKNNKYILFLSKVPEHNFYSVVSLEYGKYNLDGKDNEESEITNKSELFKKVKKSVSDKYQSIFDS
jgi:hypothetical protein